MGLWPQGLVNLAVASTSALGQPAAAVFTSGAFTTVAVAGGSQPAAGDVLREAMAHGR